MLRLLTLLLVSLFIMGFGSTANSAFSYCGMELKNQNTKRFLSGDVFYLPANQGFDCGAADWRLVQAPTSNTNEVIVGDDGYARITPVIPGRYVFQSRYGFEKTLDVIDYSEKPFENYNYYPTAAMVSVQLGSEKQLWSVSTMTGEVIRSSDNTFEQLGTIRVGPWPVALATNQKMPWVLVVNKANDTLGFISKSSQTLVDSLWVGDEPGNVVVDSKGRFAYVAMQTDDQVAVIDIASRQLVQKINVGIDPLAMTLDEENERLFVASKRSGQPDRAPWGSDPVEDEKDITIIDLTAWQVSAYIMNVASTIHDIVYRPEDGLLYMSNLRNNPLANLTKPEALANIHELSIIDPNSRTKIRSVDFSRQPSSSGPFISVQKIRFAEDRIFLLSEGQEKILELDIESLEEISRFDAPGRPRDFMVSEGEFLIHGHQDLSLYRLDMATRAMSRLQLSDDPRAPSAALGQRTFTGAGEGYGEYFSCNTCHLDSTNDALVWDTGPFLAAFVPRPHFWLEGTAPLGWSGYVASVENFGLEAHSIVNIFPSNEQAQGLRDYLASIMPPPKANSLTQRDGSLSEAAKRGKTLFYTNGCIFCHQAPLGTTKKTLDEGITEGRSDIPSLIGSYRYKSWLKHGEASTLESAVRQAVDKFGLLFWTSEKDIKALTRYVGEMTSRDFFLLDSTPEGGENNASIKPEIDLTFSHVVFASEENLERIKVTNLLGREIPTSKQVDGRKVKLILDTPLRHNRRYRVVIDKEFEAFDTTTMFGRGERFTFKTAREPKVQLQGEYQLKVDFPVFDFENGTVDPSRTFPVLVPFNAEPIASGAQGVFNLGPGLIRSSETIIDRDRFYFPPFPIPAGPGNFADGFSGLKGRLMDNDGDGVADSSSGTLTLAGPGFFTEGVTWTLNKVVDIPDDGTCESESSGNFPVSVSPANAGPLSVNWESGNGFTIFITSKTASVNLDPSAPGGFSVSGGTTHLGITRTGFTPFGSTYFEPPIRLNAVSDTITDITVENGGELGWSPEEGECYKVTVGFHNGGFSFEQSNLVFKR